MAPTAEERQLAEKVAKRLGVWKERDNDGPSGVCIPFDGEVLTQLWDALLAAEREKQELRRVLGNLVTKLRAILPIVDGIIALQYARTRRQYTGPNIAAEMAEAEALLGRKP